MKILVDKKELEKITELISDACEDTVCVSIHDRLKQLIIDSPVVAEWAASKNITPEETVEFLIEITDTLAAYLWNKKEEVTTHKYANYLDELRGKLEEYNK